MDVRIGRQEDTAVDDGLGDQHAVEGIAMEPSKASSRSVDSGSKNVAGTVNVPFAKPISGR